MGSTRGGDWQEVTEWFAERWRAVRRRVRP
jgi:hypothetical protein